MFWQLQPSVDVKALLMLQPALHSPNEDPEHPAACLPAVVVLMLAPTA